MLSRFALESICMICLDSRIGSFSNNKDVHTPSDGDVLIEATKLLFDSFNKLYYGVPIWKYFSTNAYTDLERAESIIFDVASKYVDRAIEDVANSKSCRVRFHHIDLLLFSRLRLLRRQHCFEDHVEHAGLVARRS